MKQFNRLFNIFVAASMIVALVLTAQPVQQARALTLVVTKTADTDDGTCDSDCSLREAIKEANNNGTGSDTITLPAGTYTLTFGDQLPIVSTAIIINGTSNPIIQSNASASTATYRIFEVTNNGGSGDLTLNDLTLKNGFCVNSNSCTSQDNPGSNGQGGAIFNSGKLTLKNVFLTSNKSANGGGAIYQYSGTLTMTSSTFTSNIAGSDGGGIGVNSGTVTVTGANFVSNTAGNSGGGISASGGTLTIKASNFSGNTASGSGGGLGSGATLNVKTSTFHDNSASRGAGLSNNGGSNNNIANSTFYSNTASSKGGGVYNDEDLNLTNNTFSDNSAPDGGAFYSDPYKHDVDKKYAVVVLKNNILANSKSGGDCFNYLNGTPHPVTGINNLIETEGTSPCGTTAPINGSDPKLGTLAGFPLPQYYPLLTGSPAIDKGDDATCAASPVSNTSQNGVTRPQGTHCDIGSYEFAASTTPTFADVPFTHPQWKYIQALYDAGLTAGCTTSPLNFCPDTILDRAQSAVFMVRGQFGSSYTPPPAPWTTFVNESWVGFEWAQAWAEGMYVAGLTSGCSTNPRKFCPANQLPRVEASVFGLKMKYGQSYVPPKATGTVFGDFPSTDPSYWGIDFAEQAYKDGLLPSCGTDPVSGKPMFCPSVLVNRGWAAYLIVKAKGIPTP